jgi:hypothetical protein
MKACLFGWCGIAAAALVVGCKTDPTSSLAGVPAVLSIAPKQFSVKAGTGLDVSVRIFDATFASLSGAVTATSSAASVATVAPSTTAKPDPTGTLSVFTYHTCSNADLEYDQNEHGPRPTPSRAQAPPPHVGEQRVRQQSVRPLDALEVVPTREDPPVAKRKPDARRGCAYVGRERAEENGCEPERGGPEPGPRRCRASRSPRRAEQRRQQQHRRP